MSEQTQPLPPPAGWKGGINLPDEVEGLLTRVAEMETWRADIEARLDALAGATPQQARPGAFPIQQKPKKG